ncbi:MAG: carotenoid biosynthesis protein [Halobacteriales archaeon]
MANHRIFTILTIALGVVTISHAVVTWPVDAILVFFGGGTLIAFVAEAIAINLGWLDHHVGPKFIGVPPYPIFGWTGSIYIMFRLALLATTGWTAVVTTAALAATYDLLTDHRGVADGYWTYTDDLPGPRFRGVPWWNFAGWFAVSFLLTAITIPFL